MTEKEKAVQRALGTLPTFKVSIKVNLTAADRKDALSESRKVLRFLREYFPIYGFKKGVIEIKDIDD